MGLPIQRPNRGLLVALAIVAVIVFVGRWLAAFAYRSRRFENAFQGVYKTMVKDGVLDLHQMNKSRVTRERLFAELRSNDIRHLGQVKRLYIEANGDFSLVESDEAGPGLAVIPDWDLELRQRQQETDKVLCQQCGQGWEARTEKCSHCGGNKQEKAILVPKAKA